MQAFAGVSNILRGDTCHRSRSNPAHALREISIGILDVIDRELLRNFAVMPYLRILHISGLESGLYSAIFCQCRAMYQGTSTKVRLERLILQFAVFMIYYFGKDK